jgi:hypothetical protein
LQGIEAVTFLDNLHVRVVMLSAVRSGCMYPSGKFFGTYSCWRLIRTLKHSLIGRFTLLKNSSDTSGNRTRDPKGCSAVPYPTETASVDGTKILR